MADDLGALGQAYVEVRADLGTLRRDLEEGRRITQQTLDQFAASFRTAIPPASQLNAEALKFRQQAAAASSEALRLSDAIRQLGGAERLTETQIRESVRTLREGVSAMKALGIEVPPNLQKLKVNVEQLDVANRKAARGFVEVTKENKGFLESLSGVTKVFGAYLSASAITGAVNRTLDFARAIETSSQRVGISIGRYQALTIAARDQSIQIGQLTNAITQAQGRFAEGNERAHNALARLNLLWSDLQRLSPDEQLFAISDGLRLVGSHEERIEVLRGIFGEFGDDVLPLVEQNLRAVTEEIEQSGQVVDEELVQALSDADRALERINQSGTIFLGSVLGPMAPFAEGAANAIARMSGELSRMIQRGDLSFLQRLGVSVQQFGLAGLFNPAMGFLPPPPVPQGRDIELPAQLPTPPASERELARLERERLRVLEQQVRQAEKLAQSYERAVRALDSPKLDRFFDFNRAGIAMTGEVIDPGQWRRFMQGGPVPDAFDPMLTNRLRLPSASLIYGPMIAGQRVLAEQVRPPVLPSFGSQFLTQFSAGLPDIVLASLTGGGNLGTSLLGYGGSLLGSLAAPGLASAVGGGLLGTVLGGFLPGAGALLGPLIGSFFGPSEAMQVNDLRDQFIAQFGGLDELNVAAHEAGLTLDRILSADTLEEWQRATEDLTSAIKEHEQQIRDRVMRVGELAGLQTVLSPDDLIFLNTITQGTPEAEALGQFLQQQTGNIVSGLQRVAQSGITPTAEGAQALARSAGLAFRELQRQGLSIQQIVQQMGPLVANLAKQFAEAGVTGGGAFAEIRKWVRLLADEDIAALVEGAEGVNQVLVGLANTALLDQETFEGLAGQINATYENLIEQGVSGEEALRLLQGPLQTLWQLQKDFGFQVGDSTQELLDQGEAAGIIGEQFRTMEDRLLGAIERLIKRFDQFFTHIVGAAGDAAGAIQDEFDQIEPPDFNPPDHVPGGGEYPGTPGYQGGGDYAHLGGYVTPMGVQYLARGGMAGRVVFPGRPRGSDVVPAFLTPGEGVLSTDGMRALGELNRGVSLLEDLFADLRTPAPGTADGALGQEPITAEAIAAALKTLGVGGIVVHQDNDFHGVSSTDRQLIERGLLPSMIRVLQDNRELARSMNTALER